MKKLRTPQHHHQFMTCQDDIIWLGSCSRCWFFRCLHNSSILLLSSGCGWIWSSRSRTFFPSLSIYKNEWKLRWENWIGLVLSSAVLCFPRLSLKCEFLTKAVDKQTTKRLCFLFSIPPAVAVHDDFPSDCSRWPWKSTFLRISTNARWTKGWIKDECCVAGNGITQSSWNQRNVDDDGQQRQRRFNLAQQWWCGRLFNSQQTNIATTEIIDLGSNIIRNPHIPGLPFRLKCVQLLLLVILLNSSKCQSKAQSSNGGNFIFSIRSAASPLTSPLHSTFVSRGWWSGEK